MTSTNKPQNTSQSNIRGRGRGRGRGRTRIPDYGDGQAKFKPCQHAGCSYIPKSPSDFLDHQAKHRKPKRCRNCEYEARSQQELDRHRSDAHQNSALNIFLDRGFESESELERASSVATTSRYASPVSSNAQSLQRGQQALFYAPAQAWGATPSSSAENSYHYGCSGPPSSVSTPPNTSIASETDSPASQSIDADRQLRLKILARYIIYIAKGEFLQSLAPSYVPNLVKYWAIGQFMAGNTDHKAREIEWAHYVTVNRIPIPEPSVARANKVLKANPVPVQHNLFLDPPEQALTVNLLDYLIPLPLLDTLPLDIRTFVVCTLRPSLPEEISEDTPSAPGHIIAVEATPMPPVAPLADSAAQGVAANDALMPPEEWDMDKQLELLAMLDTYAQGTVPTTSDTVAADFPAIPNEHNDLQSLIDMDFLSPSEPQPAVPSADPGLPAPEFTFEMNWDNVFGEYNA